MRDHHGQTGRESVGVDVHALMQQIADFVQQRAQILARADHADGPGENVVEHQRGNRKFRATGPMLSCTTTYTPPRTNMLQLSMYTLRTAKLNSMTPSTNQGADLPTACSAAPPA